MTPTEKSNVKRLVKATGACLVHHGLAELEIPAALHAELVEARDEVFGLLERERFKLESEIRERHDKLSEVREELADLELPWVSPPAKQLRLPFGPDQTAQPAAEESPTEEAAEVTETAPALVCTWCDAGKPAVCQGTNSEPGNIVAPLCDDCCDHQDGNCQPIGPAPDPRLPVEEFEPPATVEYQPGDLIRLRWDATTERRARFERWNRNGKPVVCVERVGPTGEPLGSYGSERTFEPHDLLGLAPAVPLGPTKAELEARMTLALLDKCAAGHARAVACKLVQAEHNAPNGIHHLWDRLVAEGTIVKDGRGWKPRQVVADLTPEELVEQLQPFEPACK